jgi:non-canonical (house-cleaning) NTP pyrophosphatase
MTQERNQVQSGGDFGRAFNALRSRQEIDGAVQRMSQNRVQRESLTEVFAAVGAGIAAKE